MTINLLKLEFRICPDSLSAIIHLNTSIELGRSCGVAKITHA